jgi:FkbM family methyltransferase
MLYGINNVGIFMSVLRKIKVLIASRKLFNNWLSAGIKYYLIRYDIFKGSIKIKCCDNEYVLSPRVYSNIINAYYNGAFEELECGESLYAVFTYRGHKIRFYDSFEFLYDIVFENFVGGAYDDLDIDNKVVIDVGAGVGDTAILFSLRGAKRVIALEPFPSLYKKALINIKINDVEDKVSLINAGLGSLDGEVYAELSDVCGYYLFKPGYEHNVKVRMYTLNSLIKEFGIERGSILKVDCEGCEYETILNARLEDLKVFDQIIIEYHNGYVELKRILEDAGFETIIKPIRSVRQPVEKQGYIVAKHKA